MLSCSQRPYPMLNSSKAAQCPSPSSSPPMNKPNPPASTSADSSSFAGMLNDSRVGTTCMCGDTHEARQHSNHIPVRLQLREQPEKNGGAAVQNACECTEC